MVKILDLLCNEQSGSYRFKKNENDYEIEDIDSNIAASIDEEGEIQYFVTGVYNSGCDWAEIDVKALYDLMQLCGSLRDNLTEGD